MAQRRSSSPSKLKRKANEQDDKLQSSPTPVRSQAVKMEDNEDIIPSSNVSAVRRRGGLLTPHPSVGNALGAAAENTDFVKDEPLDAFPLPETPPRRSPSKASARAHAISTSVAIQTSRTPSRSQSLSSLTQKLRSEASRRGLFVSPTQTPSGSVIRKPSFIRLGEKEAFSFSEDLALLAEERERLEERLECVKQAQAELSSVLADSPASFHSSIDFDDLDASNVRRASDRQSRSTRMRKRFTDQED